jgi:hypothetical protein
MYVSEPQNDVMRRRNGRIGRSSRSGRTLYEPNEQTRHDVSQTFIAHWSSFKNTSGANEGCRRGYDTDEVREKKGKEKRKRRKADVQDTRKGLIVPKLTPAVRKMRTSDEKCPNAIR